MSDDRVETRLYLSVAAAMLGRAEETAQQLDELAARLDIACVNLELPFADQAAVQRLVTRLQQQGIAVVLGVDQVALFAAPGGPDMSALDRQLAVARSLGCDGVHLPADDKLYAAARKALSADAIIGAQCGGSRHQAMLLGEQGADYVAFTAAPDDTYDLIEWWQDLFGVPCVAWSVQDLDLVDRLLHLPAEFIAPDSSLWNDEAALSLLAASCARPAEEH